MPWTSGECGGCVEVKGRRRGHALSLAVKSADEARDYAPDMSHLAQRLARRCWPGPVTLVVDDVASGEPACGGFRPPSKSGLRPSETIGLRVPGHQVVLDVLRMLAGPLVLTSANLGGQAEAVTAQQVLDALGDRIDLVLGRRAVPLRRAFVGGPRRGQPLRNRSAPGSCRRRPCSGCPA